MSYGDGFSNVPRPVFGHGLVYIATGFQQPSLLAVRADGAGDVTKTHVAWTLQRGAPQTPSPLLVGDELFIVNDAGIASWVDARPARCAGSSARRQLLRVAGVRRRPGLFLSEEGVATVIAPGPEFKLLVDEPARRGDARLDGGVETVDLHPHEQPSLSNRGTVADHSECHPGYQPDRASPNHERWSSRLARGNDASKPVGCLFRWPHPGARGGRREQQRRLWRLEEGSPGRCRGRSFVFENARGSGRAGRGDSRRSGCG